MTQPSASLLVGDVESSKVALERAFESIRRGIDTCVGAFNGIVDKFALYLPLIPPWAVRSVQLALHLIRVQLRDLLDIAQKVLQSGVPVLSLFITSIDYLNAVERPISDISYEIGTPKSDDLHHWSGAANLAYKQKQTAQKAAADRVMENATFMSKWLFDIGKANVAYAVEVVKILIDAGSEMIAVTANGFSAINIQFALDDAADAIQKLIKGGLNQLAELANRFTALIGNVRDLMEKRNRQSELQNGHWPQAVYG
jgi:hypothetical protein